jgi:hypothetical protein
MGSVDRVCQVLVPLVAECLAGRAGVRAEAFRAGLSRDVEVMRAASLAASAEEVLDRLGGALAVAKLSGDDASADQVGAARRMVAGMLAESHERIRGRLAVLAGEAS